MNSPEEMYFERNKLALSTCCCEDSNVNKIELYKLGTVGYRVFCSSCCAIADGTNVEQAVLAFQNNDFDLQPKYY